MRGDGKQHSCYCRFCVLARWRSKNRQRAMKGKPDAPMPELPAKVRNCPCAACARNRSEVAFAKRLRDWQAA